MSGEPLSQAHGLSVFDRIYVINLKRRTDRRAQMVQELAAVGLSADDVHWFDAVEPTDKGDFENIGAKGCFLSHLGILADASSDKLRSIMILEDDANFSKDFKQRIRPIADHLASTPWDMFYGGWHSDAELQESATPVRIDADVAVKTTHCLAVRGEAIGRIRAYLEAQLKRRFGDPAGGPMHVDGSYNWARRELGLITFLANPKISYQRPSRSDIHASRWWDNSPLAKPGIEMLRSIKRGIRKLS